MSSMEKGKKLYAQAQFPKAATAFTSIADACVCGVKYREKPCLCKNIARSIEADALKDELRKKCICSAKSGRRCENSAHLDALDYLAAALEKDGRLEQSLACAEQMINLSPRQPKGYLRLGKLLRLQARPMVALDTYRQGIDLVEKKQPDHALLPAMRDAQEKMKRFVRTDPLAKLPFELICLIFSSVDFRTLCRALGVSKTWKTILTAKDARVLWSRQNYTFTMRAPRNPPNAKTLMRYAFLADHQVSEIVIDGSRQFLLKQDKFNMVLSRNKQLQHLKIRGATPTMLDALPKNAPMPALKSLYLGLGVTHSPSLLLQLLQASAETLEELSVFNISWMDVDPPAIMRWPVLKRLKTIRLATGGAKGEPFLAYVMNRTPNVEEAWLDDFCQFRGFMPQDPVDSSVPNWPQLQSLFIGEDANVLVDCPSHAMPPLTPSLRKLHLEGGAARWYLAHLHLYPELFQLETFSLRLPNGPPTSAEFSTLLRPSFVSGSIREIDISPFPFSALDLSGGVSQEKPDAWFASPDLTSLALTGLTVEAGRSIGNPDDALLGLVGGRFPNVHTLDVDKESVQDVTLGRLIKDQGVRTVYHQMGQLRDDLRTWARKKYSAEVISGKDPGHPAQHPDRPLLSRKLAQGLKRARERERGF